MAHFSGRDTTPKRPVRGLRRHVKGVLGGGVGHAVVETTARHLFRPNILEICAWVYLRSSCRTKKTASAVLSVLVLGGHDCVRWPVSLSYCARKCA